MILDYSPQTEKFFARVPRKDNGVLIRDLMSKQGFFLSSSRSTDQEAILGADNAYAAVTFWDRATERAKSELVHIRSNIVASWAKDYPGVYRCPEGCELWPFQKASLAYALERQHTLIGDQPGLGKTQIAICFANEIRARRVLCIVPASLRLQWVKRIREWSTMRFGFKVHAVMTGKHGVSPNAHWTVVSYELAASPPIAQALAEARYDLLILDEAHYLKTIDTRRTRAVFGGGENRTFSAFASRSERVLALTGTPLPNRPREAYTLARSLCYDAIDWASEDDFRERFNPSMKRETTDGRMFIDERSGRHFELQNRLRGNFMTRHEKHGPNGVMHQLQMPKFDLIHLQETKSVKAALAAERLLDIDPENLEGADAAIIGQVSVVRRLMGVAMAPQVADWIDMLLDGGEEKLTVFCWHHEVLDILEQRLAKWGTVRIDGHTGATQKERLVERFKKDPHIHVAIGNMLSMGVGTDGLQEVCSHALIAEPDWVPGSNQQAIDRLDRGGQKNQVQADIFTVKGSFSERVLASALRKGLVLHDSLDNQWAA